MIFSDRKRNYVIELGGEIYSLKGKHLEKLDNLKSIKDSCLLITDMQKSMLGVMTIEAPYKYAEFILKKKLQETGEFDGPVSISTLWKKKRGKTETEILFSAVDTQTYNQYVDLASDSDYPTLIFTSSAILYSTLKNLKPEKPVAVILQNGQVIELLIGTENKIYYANRNISYDKTEGQITNLWNSAMHGIEEVETKNKVKVEKIFLLNWVDSHMREDGEWESDNYYHMQEKAVTLDGKELSLSLPIAVKNLSTFESISSWQEKSAYWLNKVSPRLNLIFFLIFLLLLGGHFWNIGKTASLSRKISRLETEKIRLVNKGKKMLPDLRYKKIISFAEELEYCRKAPPFKEIITDVSEALAPGMLVEIFKADYSPDRVAIELFVKADISFNRVHKGYKNFVEVIKEKGYEITENQLSTEVSSSNFFIKINKKIK